MAWESRNGKKAYYRTRREGKKVVRDYYGIGELARLAAALDAEKRRHTQRERALVATLRQRWLDACKPLDQLAAATRLLMRAILVAEGIKIRIRKGDGPMPTACDPMLTEVMDLVAQVDAGDTSALPKLQRLLSDQPQVYEHFGDVARIAADLWLHVYARDDTLIAEGTRSKMRQWMASIAGTEPSPLETLMIEQITICWLQAHYAEAMYAQATEAKASVAVLGEKLRQQEESQRMLNTSIRQLAELRKLLPAPPSGSVRLRVSDPVPDVGGDSQLDSADRSACDEAIDEGDLLRRNKIRHVPAVDGISTAADHPMCDGMIKEALPGNPTKGTNNGT